MPNKKIFYPAFFCLLTIIIIISGCGSNANPAAPGANPPLAGTTMPGTFTITPTATLTPVSGADIYENDDIWQNAKNIIPGIAQSRTIHVWDDEDWMKFSTASESTISITVSGSSNIYFELYKSPNFTNTVFTEGNGINPPYHSEGFMSPGTYYLKIRQFTYADPFSQINYTVLVEVEPMETHTFTYTVSPTFTITSTSTPQSNMTVTATVTPTATLYAPDIYEDDDSYETARTILPGTIETNHNLAPPGDEDWYRFTLSAPSHITFTASSDEQKYDLRMELYQDYGGGLISGVLNYVIGGDNQAYLIRDLFPGTYLIKIYDGNISTGITYSVFFAASQFTPTVTPSVTPTLTPYPSPDSYEPDDTYEDAKDITPGIVQNKNFHEPYNYDFIRVSASSPSILRLMVNGFPGQIYEYILYRNGVSSGYGSYDGQIDTEIDTETDIYQIGVFGSYCDAYTVKIELTPMTPTSTPTITETSTRTPSITATPTITITHTCTPTASPTSTSTPYWHGEIDYSGIPVIGCILSNRGNSTWTYGYIDNSDKKIFVAGTMIGNAVETSWLGRRWMDSSPSADYIVFKELATGDLYVRKSSNWSVYLGSALATGNSANYGSIYVDKVSDTPYVAYLQTATDKITVKYFNGAYWDLYGPSGFSSPASYSPAIAGIESDVFVAYNDTSAGKVNVMRGNGTTWEQFGGGYATDNGASAVDILILPGPVVYLVYDDITDGKIKLKKGTASGWVSLGAESISSAGGSTPYITGDSLSIYAVFADDNNGYKATAVKITESSWSYLNPAAFSSGAANSLYAITINGNLFAAYRMPPNYLMKINMYY